MPRRAQVLSALQNSLYLAPATLVTRKTTITHIHDRISSCWDSNQRNDSPMYYEVEVLQSYQQVS